MKKLLTCAVAALLLTGCNNSGTIDCYYIRAVSGGSVIFSGIYSESTSTVYEYRNASGEYIYTSEKPQYNDGGTQTANCSINFYADRYSTQHTSYAFARIVGIVLVQHNYYYDIGSKAIDSEIKYSQYLYEATQSPSDKINNEEAYKCIKKGYYTDISGAQPQATVNLYNDLSETGLDRHMYITLGEDTSVEYKAKWF